MWRRESFVGKKAGGDRKCARRRRDDLKEVRENISPLFDRDDIPELRWGGKESQERGWSCCGARLEIIWEAPRQICLGIQFGGSRIFKGKTLRTAGRGKREEVGPLKEGGGWGQFTGKKSFIQQWQVLKRGGDCVQVLGEREFKGLFK